MWLLDVRGDSIGDAIEPFRVTALPDLNILERELVRDLVFLFNGELEVCCCAKDADEFDLMGAGCCLGPKFRFDWECECSLIDPSELYG